MRLFIIIRQRNRFKLQIIALLILCLLFGGHGIEQYRKTLGKYQKKSEFPPTIFLTGDGIGPKLSAAAAVLWEARSGTILYAKNAEQRRAPASTTKMMTAIVALEKSDLDKTIVVSRRAAAVRGSSLYLKAGEKLRLGELLEGILLRSGNDGSVAVAEGVAGSVKKFVELMNSKAKEIGALHTQFQNPHGLSTVNHYTTALDLAMIAGYGLKIAEFARLVGEKNGFLEWQNRSERVEMKNTNRLLWYLEGADGVKTGTTGEAGHCLVASATRDNKQLIAVVLNAQNRWNDCVRLLEYGFQKFEIIEIVSANKTLRTLPINNGVCSEIAVYPRRDLVAVVNKSDKSALSAEMLLPGELEAPLQAGQVVGKICYRFNGEIINEVDLVIHKSIRRRGFKL